MSVDWQACQLIDRRASVDRHVSLEWQLTGVHQLTCMCQLIDRHVSVDWQRVPDTYLGDGAAALGSCSLCPVASVLCPWSAARARCGLDCAVGTRTQHQPATRICTFYLTWYFLTGDRHLDMCRYYNTVFVLISGQSAYFQWKMCQ